MKQVLSTLLIVFCCYFGIKLAHAQEIQYACTSSSTAQECQDKVNIDNLQVQLIKAQQAVQALISQIQGTQASAQAQLQQAEASVQNIQSEITSNEQDYNEQYYNAEITNDMNTLNSM